MSGLTGDELASMVTHELRNPLNAMAGWLHLMSHAPPGGAASPAPTLAYRAAAGLRRAVDEQLEQVETLGRVLRLAGGEPDEGASHVDLADLLQSQVDLIRAAPPAEGRAVELELGADPGGGLRPVVVGNADALARAVSDIARYAMRNGVAEQPLRIALVRDADVPQIEVSIDAGVDRSVSIWDLFRPPANRLPMPLLHARLAIESAGGVLLPVSGSDVVGDLLRIRFPAQARVGK
jgi:signal transduction histidine kinase